MDEREARRFPAGPATEPDGKKRPGYTERLKWLEHESRSRDPREGTF